MPADVWDIWADTGGTFTDAIAIAPDGRVLRQKVLSTGALRARLVEVEPGGLIRLEHAWGDWADLPDAATGWRLARVGDAGTARITKWLESRCARIDGELAGVKPGDLVELRSDDEAPILAARLLTGTRACADLPPIRLRLATTRGTNALLTGNIAPTVLVINRGLGDLLRIGTQQRPDLFALEIRKPEPLHRCVLEIAGRLDSDGREIEPLDLAAIRKSAQQLVAGGVRSAAISLMHADLNPQHELAVASLLLEVGFDRVTCSSRVAPFVKILPRATTALVNACLAPVIDEYLARVRNALLAPGSSLLVMTSAGGLVPAESFLPKDSLLSGPAAGVVGAARAAFAAGFDHAVSFDMGGTSTDAARWSREHGLEYVFEHAVGPVTLMAPAAAVETVAAGGGSICRFLDGALCVGPESAGADPGPACYGGGGPLTLTDVNLLLGRLCPERFVIPVNLDAARSALEAVAGEASAFTGRRWTHEQILEGFLEIAAERTAGAVRRISTRRGHDVRGAALVAFGGAGGQHACAIALKLGLDTVLAPADAGLLSARGLGTATIERFAVRQVLQRLDRIGPKLQEYVDELSQRACAAASADSAGVAVEVRRAIAAARFAGQEAALEIDLPLRGRVDAAAVSALFAERHTEVYGFAPGDRAVELVWLRVVAAAKPPPGGCIEDALQGRPGSVVSRFQSACFAGRWVRTPVLERSLLEAGREVVGPAILAEDHSTLIIEPGWVASRRDDGAVIIRRNSQAAAPVPSRPVQVDDPAAIELFTARFESLAREMGEMLARTSVSVNVKERLDFSCALLDASGSLIACAPHVPVHLGSLGVCVRAVVRELRLGPGDSAITNHPAHGGSHLPDVTVVTPVHDDHGVLIGYVASRAHHAEIGGRTPGSMPPDARTLSEEGVVLAPFRIVEAGRFREDRLITALRSGPYPTRGLGDNLADVRAALAANASGAASLRQLAALHGASTVCAFMGAIVRRSEMLLRARIAAMDDGEQVVQDSMDDGSAVRVRIGKRADGLTIDFTGSAAVHPGNLNATPAIVSSCIVYAMRVLLGHDVPLNEGLMRPVHVILPPGMLNPPFDPAADATSLPAVVGGNVETSQRVVDVLLRALGLAASSQGTMNNFVFGSDGLASAAGQSYYETICGGAGAGQGFDGASAVHTHMTNTRITDPEILERRYAVRLERFAIRRGTGGSGRSCGGDGVERSIRFLARQRVSLLTQRRAVGPPGLAGGDAGAAGEQILIRADGENVRLGAIAGFDVGPGDVLTIRTPGGGGYGREAER